MGSEATVVHALTTLDTSDEVDGVGAFDDDDEYGGVMDRFVIPESKPLFKVARARAVPNGHTTSIAEFEEDEVRVAFLPVLGAPPSAICA